MKESNKPTQMLLIDDDPDFGHLSQAVASSFGIDLHYRAKISSSDFGKLQNYAVIIIDYQLVEQNGLDVARSIAFDPLMPLPALVITSSKQSWTSIPQDWPQAIKRFIPKRMGVRALILSAYTLSKQIDKS